MERGRMSVMLVFKSKIGFLYSTSRCKSEYLPTDTDNNRLLSLCNWVASKINLHSAAY